MTMTPNTWAYLTAYSMEVFGSQDEHLAGIMDEAVAAGLPDISVTADVGRLLQILTMMTPGRLAIEVGTLAGYSGIWIARGLAPDGRLITIEYEKKHADLAREQFKRAGVDGNVEIRIGAGIAVLEDLATELEPNSVDVLFLDAVKTEYSDYFTTARSLIAPGGLILADNVYGTAIGWLDEGYGTNEFNRLIAADPDFDTVAVPLGDGVLIARRTV